MSDNLNFEQVAGIDGCVFAIWSADGHYYPGRPGASSGSTVHINFLDGEQCPVNENETIDAKVALNDSRIQANREAQGLFRYCRITGVEDGRIIVRYELDGATEGVGLDRVRLLPDLQKREPMPILEQSVELMVVNGNTGVSGYNPNVLYAAWGLFPDTEFEVFNRRIKIAAIFQNYTFLEKLHDYYRHAADGYVKIFNKRGRSRFTTTLEHYGADLAGIMTPIYEDIAAKFRSAGITMNIDDFRDNYCLHLCDKYSELCSL